MNPIADTGFIVATFIERDKWHHDCLELYRKATSVIVPQTVLAEVAYLLHRDGGNRLVLLFLDALPRSKYLIVPLTDSDMDLSASILRKYADTRLDFVDASVAAIAERLNVELIWTLDHRDFGMLRPGHVDHFVLQPL
jgi:uncharacterized protein